LSSTSRTINESGEALEAGDVSEFDTVFQLAAGTGTLSARDGHSQRLDGRRGGDHETLQTIELKGIRSKHPL
jgi:hypothetical protein